MGTTFITQDFCESSAAANPPRPAFMSIKFRYLVVPINWLILLSILPSCIYPKIESESKKLLTFRVSPQTTNFLPPHHEELRLTPMVTEFTGPSTSSPRRTLFASAITTSPSNSHQIVMLICVLACFSIVHRFKHLWRTCDTYNLGFPTHHPSPDFGDHYGFWEEQGGREELGKRRRAMEFGKLFIIWTNGFVFTLTWRMASANSSGGDFSYFFF